MKLKKKIIAATIAAGFMAGMSTSAVAETSPALSGEQKMLFACTEQMLSIFGAITDADSCSALDGNYDYTITANPNACVVTVENNFVLNGAIGASSVNGTQILTTTTGVQEIDGTDVRGLNGQYAYSPDGGILIHDSILQLRPGSSWEDYDEHLIKDYFKDGVFGSTTQNGIGDEGLQVITKRDAITSVRFPRSKWREVSQYREPNGVVGLHSVTQKLVVIEPFFSKCSLKINKASVVDFGSSTLQSSGKVRVRD